jgi:hypothetical protein
VKTVVSLAFKFRYVRDGRVQGMFAKKGMATGQKLVLGEESLSYDAIVDSTTRDDWLFLALSPGTPLEKELAKSLNGDTLALSVQKVKALELERYVDRMCSDRETERNRQRLIQAGKSDLFRAVACPACQAIIDLSELEKTPYVYCRFCESTFVQTKVITWGSVYRVCDECMMFDRVRGYTEFYFYFLVVAYGYSSKERHVCDNCAHAIFKKMLLMNFIFVLGIPATIYLKIKSLTGRAAHFKELAKANSLARKGRYRQASAIYSRLYEKIPEHPGLLMNEGLGHLIGDDVDGSRACFQRAQKACSNYLPVLQLTSRMEDAPARREAFDSSDFEITSPRP